MNKPDFIIIGAQKSASTFLQTSLAQHPSIWMPAGETHYFEDPDYDETPESDFLSQFPDEEGLVTGIKRPSYLGRPEVPARIEQDLPKAKLIATLRNPVARAIAAYYHMINYGQLPPLAPDKGIKLLLERNPRFLAKYPRGHDILEFGLYGKNLGKYGKAAREGRTLVILNEDIQKDPKAALSRCYGFLGVSGELAPPPSKSRPQKVIYNLPRLRLLRHRNRFRLRYRKDPFKTYPKRMNSFDKGALAAINWIDRKFAARIFHSATPRVSMETRMRLLKFYRSDIQLTACLIDRDLGHWLEKSHPSGVVAQRPGEGFIL